MERRLWLCWLIPSVLLGQLSAEEPFLFKGATLSVLEENDVFRTDQQYTQGLKISLVSADDRVPKWTKRLPVYNREGYTRNFGLHLGQQVYSPDDTQTTQYIPDDRPYAGWLYLGLSLERRDKRKADLLELDLGMVGPSSLAEPTQTRWHTIINVPLPHGWDHQLSDEPGLSLTLLRRWKEIHRPYGRCHLQFFPHLGATVGNILTQVNGGGSVRFGLVPDDFGSVVGGPLVTQYGGRWPKEGKWGWQVFAGADGRFVGRNIFLDGNTIHSSPDISKKTFVSEVTYGVAVQYRRFELAFTQFVRSPEYRGRDVQHEFGSILLSWTF